MKNKRVYIRYNWLSDDPALIAKAQELAAMRSSEQKRKSKKDYATAFNVILTAIEVCRGYAKDRSFWIPTNKDLYGGKKQRSGSYTRQVLLALEWLIQGGFLVQVEKRTFTDGVNRPYAYVLGNRWHEVIGNKAISVREAIRRNPLAPYVELRDTHTRKVKKGKPIKTKYRVAITPEQLAEHGAMIERTNRLLAAYDAMMRDLVITRGKDTHYSAETSMTRIFSRGSLNKGGRFYCPLQNLASDSRLNLRFDGEPVAEVDFSSFHPRMLYHREGLTPPADAYTIAGFIRDDVKVAFNIMLNADGNITEALKNNIDGIDDETAAALEHAIREKHEGIAKHFCTGVGLELQRLDSDIMAEVLEEFVAQGKPIATVHDSALVRVRDFALLMGMMNTAYREQVFEDQITGSSAFEVKTSKKLPKGIGDAVLKELQGEDIGADEWNILLKDLPIVADEEEYNDEDSEDANE